jgi:hypothetical protein
MMENKNNSYWIIGAGKAGTRAVERIHKKRPGAAITVVDQDEVALARLGDFPISTVCQAGASFLDARMDGENQPDWIIPAVPIHLAFEWVRLKLSAGGRVEVSSVPQEIEKMLPNPKRGPQGQLFLSYADFRCPDHCNEPYHKCTFTGERRKGILYRKVGEINFKDFRSVVIHSEQLAPGVGGYQPQALKESLAEVSKDATPVLYTTASFCHGVMHALEFGQD